MQKNIIKHLCTYFLGLVFLLPYICYTQAPFPGLNLSPEEMQQLEQELEQAAQAYTAYIESLPPAEQEEFHRAMAELEQMMSTMSEEELNQLMEAVIEEELAKAQTEGQIPVQPAATAGMPIPQKEVVITPTASQAFSGEQQKLLTILSSIIDLIDSFMVKMQNVPDISPKFDLWLQQGKLASVEPTLTWDLFKKTVEIFKKEISDMRKMDQKTKKYIFLDALLKNEALYKELSNLEAQLKTYEKQVVVVSFGIESLSSSSKSAIQKSMSALAYAVQATNAEIKKLFETYEPEAQKIREEEKKQVEKAKAEIAQQRKISPPTGGFAGPRHGMYGQPGKGFGPGGNYYDYFGGAGQPSFGGGPAGQKPEGEKGKPARGGAAGGGKPAKGGTGKEADKDKEKNKEDKDKKKDKKDKAAKKSEKEKEKKKEKPAPSCPINSESAEGTLDLIKNNLDFIDAFIDESAQLLSEIRGTITAESKPDDQLTIVTIPRLVKRTQYLDDLVKKYIEKLAAEYTDKSKVAAGIQPQLEELNKLMQKHKLFSIVLPQLTEIADELGKDDTLFKEISADNRYAYFAGKLKPKDAHTEIAEPSEGVKKAYKEGTVASLLDVHAQIQAIQKRITSLAPAQQPFIPKATTLAKQKWV